MIEKFAGYGFNKSHSTAYALIAYMTAYLKAHYPVEFMAALLVERHSGPQLQEEGLAGRAPRRLPADEHRGRSARRESLAERLRRPRRQDSLRPVGDQGLRRRRGRGDPPRTRGQGGPYTSLFDFCERLDPGTVNRTAIETLIKAGAFDSLGARRSQLFAVIDRALQSGASAAADRRHGQKSLFGDEADEDPAQTPRQLARRARVGRTRKARQGEGGARLLPDEPSAGRARGDARPVLLAHDRRGGRAEAPHRSDARRDARVDQDRRTRRTRSRASRASTRCSTWRTRTASSRSILWPEQFAQFGELVQPDAILVVRGAIDKRPGSEEANLIVNELIPLEDVPAPVHQGHHDPGRRRSSTASAGWSSFTRSSAATPAPARCSLHLCLEDGSTVACECRKLRVDVNQPDAPPRRRAARPGQRPDDGHAQRQRAVRGDKSTVGGLPGTAAGC